MFLEKYFAGRAAAMLSAGAVMPGVPGRMKYRSVRRVCFEQVPVLPVHQFLIR